MIGRYEHFNGWPCHGSGGESKVSYFGIPVSVPGRVPFAMDGVPVGHVFSEYFCFP
jgi:hypothetical protein